MRMRASLLGLTLQDKKVQERLPDQIGTPDANPRKLPKTVISKILYGVLCTPQTVVFVCSSVNGLLFKAGPRLLLSDCQLADDHSCPKHMAINGIFDNPNLRE